ncbi:hypothetical protein BV504_11640 [Halomonas sp. 'Soap Lake |nr:hypothetical protein B2G49_11785 [Halomonas sp. 'Soap Lake \
MAPFVIFAVYSSIGCSQKKLGALAVLIRALLEPSRYAQQALEHVSQTMYFTNDASQAMYLQPGF